MSDPFIAEIKMFAGNFAPRGWAFCDGQILPISSHDALFSLLGTTWGGDGRTSFALPDLRGRVAMHPGTGPGLTPRRLGETGGFETVTLSTSQIPAHSHDQPCNSGMGDEASAVGAFPANAGGAGDIYATVANADAGAVTDTGGSQPHTNLQPFGTVHYIIALVGIYPSRS